MGYTTSKPQKTESIDSAIAGWSGQNNPRNNVSKDLNPAKHGFNKSPYKGQDKVLGGGGTPGKL